MWRPTGNSIWRAAGLTRQRRTRFGRDGARHGSDSATAKYDAAAGGELDAEEGPSVHLAAASLPMERSRLSSMSSDSPPPAPFVVASSACGRDRAPRSCLSCRNLWPEMRQHHRRRVEIHGRRWGGATACRRGAEGGGGAELGTTGVEICVLHHFCWRQRFLRGWRICCARGKGREFFYIYLISHDFRKIIGRRIP
jgi:hypothetical protein